MTAISKENEEGGDPRVRKDEVKAAPPDLPALAPTDPTILNLPGISGIEETRARQHWAQHSGGPGDHR